VFDVSDMPLKNAVWALSEASIAMRISDNHGTWTMSGVIDMLNFGPERLLQAKMAYAYSCTRSSSIYNSVPSRDTFVIATQPDTSGRSQRQLAP